MKNNNDKSNTNVSNMTTYKIKKYVEQHFIQIHCVTWAVLLCLLGVEFCYFQNAINKNVQQETIDIVDEQVETVDELSPRTDIILNCPFCNGEAEIKSGIRETSAYVICSNCDISTNHYNCVTFEDAKEQAIKAWNRRYGGN